MAKKLTREDLKPGSLNLKASAHFREEARRQAAAEAPRELRRNLPVLAAKKREA